jgi:hypothetical protein
MTVLAAILALVLASHTPEKTPAQVDPTPPGTKLLIVVPAGMSDALAGFVEFKKARTPVEVINLNDALARNHGCDDAEKLKHELFTAWKDRGVRYVLLVGDADVLPVRYMALDRVTPQAFDYAFYPSDLYYADVAKNDGSFEDWNGRKDGFHAGYFGEVRGEKNKTDPINYDGVDYLPELAVGRWPVSTAAQAKVVADKTMAYQRGLESGTKPGAATAEMVAVGGWVDARATLDGAAKSLGEAWTTERLYYSDGPADDAAKPDESHVVKAMNTGVGLVMHAGHGADDRWEGSLSVKSIAKLHNADRLPVVLSAGCSTARFATLPPYEPYVDNAGVSHKGTNAGEVFKEPPPPPSCYATGAANMTGLGERLLRDGPDRAVAYFGCNTGSQPCGLTLLSGFAKAASTQRTIGDCWAEAVTYYFEREHLATIKPTADWYPASIYFQGMKYMLLGDPSAPMPAAPQQPQPAGPAR